MPLVIKGSQDFEPAPPGLHHAVCVDVVNLGYQETKFGKKKQLKIVWQLKARDQKGKRFQVRRTYTQSLNDKSNLRHDLETWRGRPFSRAELVEFDIEKLLGANCQMQVIHRISAQGRTYANPQAIVPAAKGMEVLTADDYEREPWPDGWDDVPEDSPMDEAVVPEDDGSDVPFAVFLAPLAGLLAGASSFLA